ncbi:MAG: peptidase S10 [Candidatus Eremiobacteraeota bacterium]|nr:peptidase S10 [Candidatus Eremiobacteraeota bacterium]
MIVPDAVTHHTLSLRGRSLRYTARAGSITIRDDQEKPQASMFYTAYTLEGADARTRPVTFFYNGGPGSSTIWLRMGSFGPVRVVTANGKITAPAPYTLVDNQDSLLDATDMVFIDMAASGFGRILPGGKAKNIFGSDNDVKAFAQFIERYLLANNRWNSPKFLFGESYGTPRSAMLVDYLQQHDISVNGVVLQSSILNYSLASSGVYGGADTDDWQYVFALPTEAATAYYYKAVPGAPSTLAAYMREVTHFAMTDYRRALDQGNALTPAKYDAIVAKLHRYLGISEQYVRNSDLRVQSERYIAEFRREQGKTEGVYDSRYQLYTLDRAEEYPSLEATDASIDSAYFTLGNRYLRETLRYHTPLLYQVGAYATIAATGGWDFKHNGGLPLETAPDLAEAMTFNPNLRIFSANGYYDSVTPFFATVYSLQHLNLVPALQGHIAYGFYPSGHMIYLNPAALAAFRADLERWYSQTLRVR